MLVLKPLARTIVEFFKDQTARPPLRWNALAGPVFFCALGSIAPAAIAQDVTIAAHAGADISISLGAEILLDATGSTVSAPESPNIALEYSWSVLSAPQTPIIDGALTPRPVLGFTVPGTYRFSVAVSAGDITASDEVDVFVGASELALRPITNAGLDRAINVGELTTLDGTASISPSGRQLSYNWSILQKPEGSFTAFDNPSSPRPNFTPDIAGDYSFELTTTDSSGLSSEADIVFVSTGNIPPFAQAGRNQSLLVGQTASLDPEGTIDGNGDRLDANWSILYAPSGSTANLTENEGGRFALTPDVAGDYVVQLSAVDGNQATSLDTVTIHAVTDSASLDGLKANLRPDANAGANQIVTAESAALLDGTESTDADNDILSYRWSLLSRPADSFSNVIDSNSARSAFVPDTDRTFVLQLAVTDESGQVGYDTVVLSSLSLPPIARSGGPEANADGPIANTLGSVDGANSIDGQGSFAGLNYDWAVLGLSGGQSEIVSPTNASTDVTFIESSSEGGISDAEAVEGLAFISQYNLISFGDLNSNVDTQGRVLVGGDIVGGSSTYATGVQPASGLDVLEVVGDIKGGPKNINNGGNVRVGGRVKSRLNLNGGGSVITDTSLSITAPQLQAIALSNSLYNLASNSAIQLPSGQLGPARLNAQPDSNGIAVFSLPRGNDLFKNNNVQQIEVNANGASSIIVNVGGNNVVFNKGNFVGAVNSDEISRKIIWNFYEATQVKIFRGF